MASPCIFVAVWMLLIQVLEAFTKSGHQQSLVNSQHSASPRSNRVVRSAAGYESFTEYDHVEHEDAMEVPQMHFNFNFNWNTYLHKKDALPFDRVVKDLSRDGPRFQYVQESDGPIVLADLWLKEIDLEQVEKFTPDDEIVYHLYTRENPDVSQSLFYGMENIEEVTNFNPERRTIVLVHGWRGGATSGINTKLTPAFLTAEDVNVIVVDWSTGSGAVYIVALRNTSKAGKSVARFISWLNAATGAHLSMYHLLGHSLGGHFVGIVGRNLGGKVNYITAMDPAKPGWDALTSDKFRKDDGVYTEVIHTNIVGLGYMNPLGKVDFYPNRGGIMPGCYYPSCSHSMVNNYLQESIVNGGFTGRRCATLEQALWGTCSVSGTLRMGGLTPNTGATGIYYLETNSKPPYSKG